MTLFSGQELSWLVTSLARLEVLPSQGWLLAFERASQPWLNTSGPQVGSNNSGCVLRVLCVDAWRVHLQ